MKVSSKKKLLGILTAAAIVVTAVGSFAVWDELSKTAVGTATLGTPVKVSTSDFAFNTELAEGVQEGTVTFNVSGATSKTGLEMRLVPTVTSANSDKVTVAIKEGATDTTVEDSNIYTVVITPTDNTVAGQAVTVDVVGTLVDTTKTPSP